MRHLWLLLLLPNVCAARIVQVDDLVKPAARYGTGTVLHETTTFMLNLAESASPTAYKVAPAFRYRFGGWVREGGREYIKLTVQNLFVENLLARDQARPRNSKGEPLTNDLRAQSSLIVLMLPLEKGRAQFSFPRRVVGKSNAEQVPVSEALFEVVSRRLRVLQVTAGESPASKLRWVPPREWPRESETIYLDASNPAAGGDGATAPSAQ